MNTSKGASSRLSQSIQQLGLPVARRLHPLIWPVLAKLYRSNATRVSGSILYALGIADPSHRPNFATLARVVDTVPMSKGCLIGCGVYRGATLLGMAHRLALRGVRNVDLIGCDSFEGFPQEELL